MKPSILKNLVNRVLQVCTLPQEISTVIHRQAADEVVHASEAVNLIYEDIWRSVQALYRTCVYPGIGFCLRHQGEIRIHGVLGHARGNGPQDRATHSSTGNAVLLNSEDPICLFSSSKAVTAMLVHALVETGEMGLDDKLSKYLPHFGRSSPTLLQILAHQAGIPKLPLGQGIETIFDHEAMVSAMNHIRPEWAAGDKVGYHAISSGYLLAEVIRKVSGLFIEDFLQATLSEPMGLSCLRYGLGEADADKAARNYFTGLPLTPPFSTVLTNALGASVQNVVDISNDPKFQSAVVPSASIMSTAKDISAFFQMLLDHGSWQGKQIYQADTIATATTACSKLKIDYILKVPMRYTPGMMLGENPVGLFGPFTKKAFGHLGFTNNLCWADPDRDLSVALLTTGKPVVGPHLSKLVKFVTQVSRLNKAD